MARSKMAANKAGNDENKSLESWGWDATCSIRGAIDTSKYKEYILALVFVKRFCDVYDDELNRIDAEVGSRKKAFQLSNRERNFVHFPAGAGFPGKSSTDRGWVRYMRGSLKTAASSAQGGHTAVVLDLIPDTHIGRTKE